MNPEHGKQIELLQFFGGDKAKHRVTNKTLETLAKVMKTQDEYGIQKYGKPLHHAYNYDWLQMFLEEMADGLKYIQNEIDRRKSVINLLEYALESDNPQEPIKVALGILKTEGTGK
jgi:predicted outer membrane protein